MFSDLPVEIREKIRMIGFTLEKANSHITRLHNTSDREELLGARIEAEREVQDVLNRLGNLKIAVEEMP